MKQIIFVSIVSLIVFLALLKVNASYGLGAMMLAGLGSGATALLGLWVALTLASKDWEDE